jgi:hypothetical protein
VKIAFDENMPASVVVTLRTIGEQKGLRRHFQGLQIVQAKQYAPALLDKDYKRKDDGPWLKRYKADGGKVIISGDVSMPDKPHELLAIQESGLVAFFFPAQWNNWKFARKAALLLVWLDRIIAQAKLAKAGTLYRIPNDWRPGAALKAINPPTALRLKEVEHPVRPPTPKAVRTRRQKPLREAPPMMRLMEQPEGES